MSSTHFSHKAMRQCLHHKAMLQDEVRVSAYQRAIFEIVKEGDVVVDLGSGTGLLGFFACQAKAKRVYAIERNDIIDCAQKLCDANGFQDRMVFIKDNSANIVLPEKADVIVSEMLGDFCLEENLTRFVADARDRFLKPGGVLVPSRAEMFMAPVETFDAYDEHIEFWSQSIEGLDYSLVRTASANRRYTLLVPANGILAAPICVKNLNFYSVQGDVTLDREVTFIIERNGMLHGLAGWFEAQLSHNVHLSTGPASQPTHWKQTFFPIAEPISVIKGDSVIARIIAIDVGRVFWEWRVEIIETDGARKVSFAHSNFVPTRKDLVLQMPDFRPELSDSGRIERSVLDWCDGKATVREIAGRLQRQFPEQCPTEEAAMRWVGGSLKGKVEVAEESSVRGKEGLLESRQDGKDDRTVEETSIVSPRYFRNPNIVLREDGLDGGLVFNPGTSQIRVLNVTGWFIWKLCDGSRDLPAIVEAIQEFFDGVPEDQVASQATEFIDEMMAAGFIGIVETQSVTG